MRSVISCSTEFLKVLVHNCMLEFRLFVVRKWPVSELANHSIDRSADLAHLHCFMENTLRSRSAVWWGLNSIMLLKAMAQITHRRSLHQWLTGMTVSLTGGDIWQCLETMLVIITGGLLQASSVQSPGTLLNILQWQDPQCISSSGTGKVCYKWSVTRDWSFHSNMLKQGSKKTETFCVVVCFTHIITESQSRKDTSEFTSEPLFYFDFSETESQSLMM